MVATKSGEADRRGANDTTATSQFHGGFAGLATEVAETGPGAVETNDSIGEKCKDYQNLFGILDAMWATVRGVDAGLLSTDEQLDFLERTVQTGKELWIRMGIGAMQPKWHLAFDGHLV